MVDETPDTTAKPARPRPVDPLRQSARDALGITEENQGNVPPAKVWLPVLVIAVVLVVGFGLFRVLAGGPGLLEQPAPTASVAP
ncbi:MAG: hypothetical protein EPN91_02925 [Salinibacterium sp.]|nr:MAG: hypothetical protein EPN91_02925 [Salinibacterium sp.]